MDKALALSGLYPLQLFHATRVFGASSWVLCVISSSIISLSKIDKVTIIASNPAGKAKPGATMTPTERTTAINHLLATLSTQELHQFYELMQTSGWSAQYHFSLGASVWNILRQKFD